MSTRDVDECKNFIKEVRLRPALWDKNDPDYGHRETCETHWDHLGEKFGASTDQIKIKWRNLRDSFRRNFRREIMFRKTHPTKKFVHRWKYFVPLLFLKAHLGPGKKKEPFSLSFIKPKVEENSDHSENELMNELSTLETAYDEEQENCNIPTDENDIDKNTIFKDPQKSFQISQEPFSMDNIKPSTVLSDLLKSFQKDIIELEKEKANSLNLDATDDDVLFLHSLLPYFRSLDMKKKLLLRTQIQQLVCANLTDEDNIPLNKFCS